MINNPFSSFNNPLNMNSASTSASNIVIHQSNINPNIFINGGMTNTTTATNSNSTIKIDLKKCRTCGHAHLEGQKGCIESIAWMVTFVTCNCGEYVPYDNLEYLEWCYNKKQKKESL